MGMDTCGGGRMPLPVRCWAQGFRGRAFGAKAPASEAGAPPRRPILEMLKPAEAESSCCRQIQVSLHPGQKKQARQDEASPFPLPLASLSGALCWQKLEASRRKENVQSPNFQKNRTREGRIWSCQIIPEKLATPWNFFIKFPSSVQNMLDISKTRALIPKTLKDRTEKLATDVPFRVILGAST